jgi:CRP/FNR family transcriptional regulator, cyclic AMP receptor protein
MTRLTQKQLVLHSSKVAMTTKLRRFGA